MQWIIKGVERIETLVSISTDGSILEWNLKKGLVVSSLMQLKKSGAGDGWISNAAAGLCFDFQPSDSSTYVTGTEDGSIHRCSISYNEQYLDTFTPHEGPVQKVRFSNKWTDVFISCSADWSMALYHLKSKNPLLSIRATGEDFPITDISWCPDNSTVFACVTVDSKLQIWDLSVSCIEPVINMDTSLEVMEVQAFNDTINKDMEFPPPSPNAYISKFEKGDPKEDLTPVQRLLKNLTNDTNGKKTLTCLKFGEKTPTIVVGDSNGVVSVYRIFDPITITHQGPLQQKNKLINIVQKQTDPAR